MNFLKYSILLFSIFLYAEKIELNKIELDKVNSKFSIGKKNYFNAIASSNPDQSPPDMITKSFVKDPEAGYMPVTITFSSTTQKNVNYKLLFQGKSADTKKTYSFECNVDDTDNSVFEVATFLTYTLDSTTVKSDSFATLDIGSTTVDDNGEKTCHNIKHTVYNPQHQNYEEFSAKAKVGSYMTEDDGVLITGLFNVHNPFSSHSENKILQKKNKIFNDFLIDTVRILHREDDTYFLDRVSKYQCVINDNRYFINFLTSSQALNRGVNQLNTFITYQIKNLKDPRSTYFYTKKCDSSFGIIPVKNPFSITVGTEKDNNVNKFR